MREWADQVQEGGGREGWRESSGEKRDRQRDWKKQR